MWKNDKITIVKEKSKEIETEWNKGGGKEGLGKS